jgi:hypothetical protein
MNTTRRAWILAIAILAATAYGPTRGMTTEKSPVLPVEVSSIPASELPAYAEWVGRSGLDPVSYGVTKCREHQLVIFGETHYVKEVVELFTRIAIEAYHKAGVRVVAMEACNAEDNERIARLVNGTEYDERLAYEIARAENWALWGYKEYWDVLKAVWNLNRSLPAGSEPMSVVGIDKTMSYQLDALWREGQLKDPALIEKAKNQPSIYDRDDWLVANLENEIFAKGRKGILLVGFNHSFTHYGQPRFDKERKKAIGTWARMGLQLFRKYGDKVFQMGVHLAHEPSMILREGDKGERPVIHRFLESVMAAAGNKPVAFDVPGSPFAPLRDGRSYYFYWQPEATFADLYRGFVFLKPLKDLTRCGWLERFISEEMFERDKAYYEHAYKRTFKDAREANEFFASGKADI